ncbi:hypothetical protein D3C73_809160 [compost metagenome]
MLALQEADFATGITDMGQPLDKICLAARLAQGIDVIDIGKTVQTTEVDHQFFRCILRANQHVGHIRRTEEGAGQQIDHLAAILLLLCWRGGTQGEKLIEFV